MGHSSITADEKVLHQCAEEIAARRFKSRSPIANLRRAPMRYLGSYDCDSVAVRLIDGTEFRFFLKDYGFSRRTKDSPIERREREVAVYQEILSQAKLGTPGYYGSIWDDSQGRYWLLLELVEGVLIKDHSVEHGVRAAQWLGRSAGFFRHHPHHLVGCDFLIGHDAQFFRSKAETAVANVARIAPESGSALARIVERYEPAIRAMVEQPLTLVHGGYIPWHIILNFNGNPVRVCPIDWELAALGQPLYDLAFFIDGAEREAREEICEAYRRSARLHGAPLPTRTHMNYLINCYRLHRIFDWLSRGIEKGFSEDKVGRLVAQAERHSREFLV